MKRVFGLILVFGLAACSGETISLAPLPSSNDRLGFAPAGETSFIPAPPKVEPAKPVEAAKPVPRKKRKHARKSRRRAENTGFSGANPSPATKAVDEEAAKRDCTADAFRFCTFAMPYGRKSIVACMVKNRTKLSPQCLSHFSG